MGQGGRPVPLEGSLKRGGSGSGDSSSMKRGRAGGPPGSRNGPPSRGGFRGGGRGGFGPRGPGGFGPGGPGGFGPGGPGGFGGPGGPGGFNGPPEFAPARYGFFTNESPSVPVGHVGKINSDSGPPPRGPGMMTPSPATMGGGEPRPMLSGGNWAPLGPRSVPLGGPSALGGPPGSGGPPASDAPAPRLLPSLPPAAAAPPPRPAASVGGSIHELFGKMVWKKMEQIEDAVAVDTLQNEIMELIGKAVKKQQEDKAAAAAAAPPPAPAAAESSNGLRDNGSQPESMSYGGRPGPTNSFEGGPPPGYGKAPPQFGGYPAYQGPGFF